MNESKQHKNFNWAWSELGETIFLHYTYLAEQRQYVYALSQMWTTTKVVAIPETPIRLIRTPGQWEAMWDDHGALVAMTFNPQSKLIDIRVSAASDAQCLAVAAQLLKQYPVLKSTDDTVPWHFWTESKTGPKRITRKIETVSWKGVSRNYSAPLQERLAGIMGWAKPPGSANGRLILWHGDPGTGKSHALRALATEWKEWCRFSYITDPPALLAGGAEYIFTVLDLDRFHDDDDPDKQKWQCLVFEDAGELIVPDAKERVGVGLSRLLNLADGVLGQGSNFFILISTNEDFAKLHPAVARPGRCIANMQFTRLTAAESQAWGKAHKLSVEPKEHTLAELYAMIAPQILTPREDKPPGFRKR